MHLHLAQTGPVSRPVFLEWKNRLEFFGELKVAQFSRRTNMFVSVRISTGALRELYRTERLLRRKIQRCSYPSIQRLCISLSCNSRESTKFESKIRWLG